MKEWNENVTCTTTAERNARNCDKYNTIYFRTNAPCTTAVWKDPLLGTALYLTHSAVARRVRPREDLAVYDQLARGKLLAYGGIILW